MKTGGPPAIESNFTSREMMMACVCGLARGRLISKHISPPARYCSTACNKIQQGANVFLERVYLRDVPGLLYLDEARARDAFSRSFT